MGLPLPSIWEPGPILEPIPDPILDVMMPEPIPDPMPLPILDPILDPMLEPIPDPILEPMPDARMLFDGCCWLGALLGTLGPRLERRRWWMMSLTSWERVKESGCWRNLWRHCNTETTTS